jgi:PAS domain S-box-containing protein
MEDTAATRSGLTATDIARLGEKEALERLELLALTGRSLDATLDHYDQAINEVADACVSGFADMCAVEIIEPDGSVRAAAYRFTRSSGLNLPPEWSAVGRIATSDRRPVLTFSGGEEPPEARRIRERLEAQSLMVVPIAGAGLTVGWLILATGKYRRGFRPSALRIAVELGSRIGTSIQRVTLHREMQASVREQSRTVRRLRRLATAATHLAGAATTQAVLDIACVEACVIHEADGAVARWVDSTGSMVTSQTGTVDGALADEAFASASSGEAGRGKGWVAYPLPHSDPADDAALVVFVEQLSTDEELVLSSLASLVPVAFERALSTEITLAHEARLRAVVEASPVALIGIEATGLVTMANRAAQDLLGWTSGGETWRLVEPWSEPLLELTASVLQSEGIVHLTSDIGERNLSLSGALLPAPASSGRPSVLIAGVDLSEVRRAERALVQAQRLEAMGQVAGRVAHDFNNLLTLIIGYSEILGRGDLNARQQDMISSIEGAASRAATLTKQMLDMTRQRVDSGAVIDLGREISGLDAVLARVVGPQVELRVRAPHDLINVRLDPSEMEQIVVNLVINASDAMDGVGSIDVTVEIADPSPEEVRELDLPDGPLALLTVADSGPGMSQEVLTRCLEPFFTTKDRGRGSGLGLPTVYGLVKERGGQLRIDSAPGAGTAICIWLPLARDAARSSGTSDTDTWPADRTASGRVMFVEDDDDIRTMSVQHLRSIGLDVSAYPSAEDALAAAARSRDFDVLATDVMLPGRSGVDLASELRELIPGIPVLYMTGYMGDAGSRLRDVSDPVLRKPYRPDALRLKIAELLESAALGSAS